MYYNMLFKSKYISSTTNEFAINIDRNFDDRVRCLEISMNKICIYMQHRKNNILKHNLFVF